MSGRRSEGGAGGRDRTERLSRALSALLRHNAVAEGLHVRPDGYVAVDELLRHRRFADVTFAELEHIVATNEKQRFTLTVDEYGAAWVKANQGHTLAVVTELELERITDLTQVPVVVHGTSRRNWALIAASGGLHCMGRQHVHFAAGLPNEDGVISGMRAASEVYVYLDAARALEAGMELYRSPNGVLLTPGFGNWVPLRYVSRVVTRSGQSLPFDPETPMSAASPPPPPHRQHQLPRSRRPG